MKWVRTENTCMQKEEKRKSSSSKGAGWKIALKSISGRVWTEGKKNTKQPTTEFESLLFSCSTLIQMNQAALRPPTAPRESPISTRSITITAALFFFFFKIQTVLCEAPQAEGYINIELDKVLFFLLFLCFIFSYILWLSSNIPRSAAALSGCGATYFKKLQLPYDSSAKRFSFNLNQQMCGAQT